MKKCKVATLVLAVVCLFFTSLNVASASKIESEIINQVNQQRKENGLNELRENEILNKAAFFKAQDMIGNNYFAHTSPKGVDPWHWLDKVEYQYKYAGENLAMNFSSALSVHNAWMKSKTHRDNIISEKYREIGVAVMDGVIDGKETRIAVQFFGNPLNEKTAVIQTEVSEDDAHKDIKLEEVSVRPWKESGDDEMLVYAKLSGQLLDVEVYVGKKYFSLEKIQDQKYMSLVSLEGIDLNKDNIVVKAQVNKQEALYFQVPKGIYAEYIPRDNDVDGKKVLATVASIKSTSLIMKQQVISAQNVVLSGFMLVCIIMIGNVWILEKEEEMLLRNCHP